MRTPYNHEPSEYTPAELKKKLKSIHAETKAQLELESKARAVKPSEKFRCKEKQPVPA